MTRSFSYDDNLKGMVDISSDGLETAYHFTIYDVQKKQYGKVSITCNNFERIDQNELDNLNAATEKCDGTFDDWWKKYKELGDIDRLEMAARLISCVIAEFKSMQQRQEDKK